MVGKLLIPSLEARLRGLIEVSRRNLHEHGLDRGERLNPTVTLAREFGCEGYPVALALQGLLEKQTGRQWVVMDRALLEAVAKEQHVSEQMLANLGAKNRFLDDMLSTLSPRWKSDKDYYRLLCRQIVSLAQQGNVILVGRGATILCQDISNCYHFRLVAPISFRIASLSSRLGIPRHEASELIDARQRQRDAFVKDFLGRDIAEPTLYNLIFNNARCSVDRIAAIMAEVVVPETGDGSPGRVTNARR
jgi:cytidylate kinase